MIEQLTGIIAGAKTAAMGGLGVLTLLVGLGYSDLTAKAVDTADRVKLLESNHVAVTLKLQGLTDQLGHNDKTAKLIQKANDESYGRREKLLESILAKVDDLKQQ